MEETTAENVDLAEQFQHSKVKNNGLKVAVRNLVECNEENIKHMSMLEENVAAKKRMIDEMGVDVCKLSTTCKEMAAENAALNRQLELSKAASDWLNAAVQDLESKNTYFTSEIKTLMSSMKEVVKRNEALQAQIVQISAAKEEFGEVYANKNAKLVDAFSSLTELFNDERSNHKREIKEVKNMMEMDRENHTVIIQKLEEDLKNVKARLTAQMAAQKESLEARIANLVKSCDKARENCRDASCQNNQLLTKVDKVEKSVDQTNRDLVGAIGMLD